MNWNEDIFWLLEVVWGDYPSKILSDRGMGFKGFSIPHVSLPPTFTTYVLPLKENVKS